MNINFNTGKKVERIEEEEINEVEEVEDDDEQAVKKKQQKKHNAELKKQLIRFMGIVAVLLILFFIVMLLLSLTTKRNRSFTDVEKIMKEAGEKYMDAHSEYLPEEGDVIDIPATNLINEEYMKDFSELITDENTTCNSGTSYVTVENSAGKYVYSPYLDCGDSYVTTELYKVVASDDNIVTSGYGLYAINGAYVFKGDNVNNYVKLGDYLWQIVRINNDNTITLVFAEGIRDLQSSWDDRFNTDKGYEIGINSYQNSRVREKLETIFKGKYQRERDSREITVISDTNKAKLAAFDMCVGKRSHEDTSKNNETECIEKMQNQYVGLLTASEYMNASLDVNCTNTLSESCQNYNYLKSGINGGDRYKFCLATGDSSNTYDVYGVTEDGNIEVKHAINSCYIRPVVHLKENVYYKSGKGTYEKPYKIK